MKSASVLGELARVLRHEGRNGLRTAVPVFGDGLNVEAARQAGVPGGDAWSVILRSLGRHAGIGAGPWKTLPEPFPLRWDALVRKLSEKAGRSPERADRELCNLLCQKLRELERNSASLPLYGMILGAGFENVISLSVDRRLALHSGRETFVADRGKSVLDRSSVIPHERGRTRVWYPYGDTLDQRVIELGMMHHARRILELEDRRGYLMKDWTEKIRVGWTPWVKDDQGGGSCMGITEARLKSPKRFYEQRRRHVWSAYDLFFLAPLVFVGATLCLEDWPIWWLLHQRARNFVPFKRSQVPKTYYLTVCGGDHAHLRGCPSGIELIEFPSHDELWAFLACACAA